MYVRMQVSINPCMRLLAYVSTVGAHIGTYSAAVAAGATGATAAADRRAADRRAATRDRATVGRRPPRSAAAVMATTSILI